MVDQSMSARQETSGLPPTDQSATGSAKQKTTQTAQAAAESGTQVAQTAADQAKNVAAEAKSQARDLAGEARNQLQDQARQQQQRAAGGLHSLADELRSMADNSDQSGVATEMVRQASQRAHGVAEWLSDREPGDLLGELRSFARRRPGAFLFGAAVAGVVAGRLTKGVTAASSSGGELTSRGPVRSEPVSTFGTDVPVSPMGAEEPPAAFGEPGGSPVIATTTPEEPIGGARVSGTYPSSGSFPGSGGTYPGSGTYPPSGGYPPAPGDLDEERR